MNKSFPRVMCVLLTVLLLAASAAACNPIDLKDTVKTDNNAAAQGTSESASQTTSVEAFDPMAKYDPPVVITSCKIEDSSYEYKQGTDVNNNKWIDLIREELGIELKYEWTAGTGEIWKQKLQVLLFSSDLPDFFTIEYSNQYMYNTAVESGIAADMTDIYEKYASDQVKSFLSADGGASMDMAKRNGRLYCLPGPTAISDTAQCLFIRKDCLENVGLDIPKSMDDVINLMRAFTENDPDKNGKDDTYGLAVDNSLFSGYCSLIGFFAGYGSYVGRELFWVEKNGKLECSLIQPETREALQAITDCFKKGYLDPEFGVKNGTKLREEVGAGIFPMMYGIYSAPSRYNALVDEQIKNGIIPPMDLWVAAPPSEAGGDAMVPVTSSVNYTVVNKKCKNPEAVVKLLNLGTKMYNLPGTEEGKKLYNEYFTDPDGFQYFKYCPLNVNNLGGTISRYEEAMAVVDGKKKMEDITTVYASSAQRIMNFENGDYSSVHFLQQRAFGRQSAGSVIKQLFNDGKLLSNAYYGPTTDNMAKNLATLKTMQDEFILQVITGHKDISEFDKFVNDWKTLGGDAITEEVNKWYQDNK